MFFSTKQFSGKRKSTVMGTMPVRGQNTKDDPQFLDPTSGLYILNYYLEGTAKLEKRKGTLLSVNAGSPIKDEWLEWDATYDIFAYDQYIKVRNRITGVISTIKSDLTPAETHGGAVAGDYVFFTNKTDGLIRVKRKLVYNVNTSYAGNNFMTFNIGAGNLVDNTITGAGGAIGEIVTLTETDGGDGAEAVVTVTSGTFELGEQITVTTHLGVQAWTLTSINNFSYYSNQVPYTSRAVNPIGTKITGETSGETAQVVFDSYTSYDTSQTSNFLTLTDVTGDFADGEIVTGDKVIYTNGVITLYARATVTSYAITAEELYDLDVNSAPKAGGVSVLSQRVFLFDLIDAESATNYCAIPTIALTGRVATEIGDNFTDATGFTSAGLLSYKAIGRARSCTQIGSIYATFCDNGWYAWTIDAVTLGSTVGKSNTEVAYRIDAGGARGALVTPIGLCVANEAGVTAIYGLGQTNVPYSKQAKLLTDSLGGEFFEDVTYDNCSMAYDERRQVLYVACAKNSTTNNIVLVIRAESGTGSNTGAQGAVTLFDWPVNRFLKRADGTLYAATTDGDLYQLDVGSEDNGAPIHTEYLQELNFGLTDLFNLEEWYWKGELSYATSINVSFDTYDKDMYYRENVKDYTWEPTNSYSTPSGWGESGWGETGFGGGSSISGLVEDLNGVKPKLRNLSRVRIRFISDDYAPHIINWMSGSVSPVRQNRKRTSPNS